MKTAKEWATIIHKWATGDEFKGEMLHEFIEQIKSEAWNDAIEAAYATGIKEMAKQHDAPEEVFWPIHHLCMALLRLKKPAEPHICEHSGARCEGVKNG